MSATEKKVELSKEERLKKVQENLQHVIDPKTKKADWKKIAQSLSLAFGDLSVEFQNRTESRSFFNTTTANNRMPMAQIISGYAKRLNYPYKQITTQSIRQEPKSNSDYIGETQLLIGAIISTAAIIASQYQKSWADNFDEIVTKLTSKNDLPTAGWFSGSTLMSEITARFAAITDLFLYDATKKFLTQDRIIKRFQEDITERANVIEKKSEETRSDNEKSTLTAAYAMLKFQPKDQSESAFLPANKK